VAEIKKMFSDNEYTIMSEIVENENVTQRELSKKLGLSLGSVNVLVNKMIKEGLIKMEQVSQKQVFYMLTPAGMVEKAKKTVRYLKVHYRAIYEMKEKIKSVLGELNEEHDAIFILMCDDEMSKMISVAVNELRLHHSQANIKIIDKKEKLDKKNLKSPVLLYMAVNEEELKEYGKINDLSVVNLMEIL